MPASDQQRGDCKTAHRRSLAQKLGFLYVAVGVACSSDASLPDGRPVDPDDLDGDGIPNAADNCPLARNVGQHDEDGDRFGDSCDDCPVLAQSVQSDVGEINALQFGDGIGDACDPRPSRDGDVVADLHPFPDDTNLGAWSGDGWTIAGDAAHASGAARWQHRQQALGDGLYVQARIPAIVWQAADAHVDVVVDGDGIELGLVCSVARDRDGDGNDELEARENAATPVTRSLGAAVTGALVITAWRTIDRNRIGRLFCRVEHAGGELELQLPTSEPFGLGTYALASAGALTDVSSVIVYTFPMACVSVSGERACPPPR